MKDIIALVDYGVGKSKACYGPFTWNEYQEFEQWIKSVVDPEWLTTVDWMQINTTVTDAFFKLKEIANA